MITEDYVSFETAKLLKEKGFDWSCRARYGRAGSFCYEKYPIEASGCEMHNCILAPTLQMAMKWLREKHFINPIPYALSLGWVFEVLDLLNKDITGCRRKYSMDMPSKSECYKSYEEAADAAIQYCLENLI